MKPLILFLSLLAARLCAVEAMHREIEYTLAGRASLKLDFSPMHKGASATPFLIYIRGGAWRAEAKDKPPILPLTEQGFAVASVDYRLTTVAPFPANVNEIEAAFRFLRTNAGELNCDARRFVIVDSSPDGHLAALAGVTDGNPELEGEHAVHDGVSSEVQAIVSFFGTSNLQSILGQSTPRGLGVRMPALRLLLGGLPHEKTMLAKRGSLATHVGAKSPPLLLIHGDSDPQMPIEQSRELHAAYERAKRPVEFVTMHGSVHGGAEFYDRDRLALIAKFLRTHLGEHRT